MWESVPASILGSVMLAFLAHQITRGGRRWRALTVACHELQAAQCLATDDDLAIRLRSRAAKRLERYLRERAIPGKVHRRRLAVWLAVAVPIAVLMAVLGERYDLSIWVLFVFGAFLGGIAALMDDLYVWLTRPPLPQPDPDAPAAPLQS